MSPSYTSKAGRTFFISNIIASHQSVLPFSLSISIASVTNFGILIPYLCVLDQYLLLSFFLILSFFRDIWYLPCKSRYLIQAILNCKCCSDTSKGRTCGIITEGVAERSVSLFVLLPVCQEADINNWLQQHWLLLRARTHVTTEDAMRSSDIYTHVLWHAKCSKRMIFVVSFTSAQASSNQYVAAPNNIYITSSTSHFRNCVFLFR